MVDMSSNSAPNILEKYKTEPILESNVKAHIAHVLNRSATAVKYEACSSSGNTHHYYHYTEEHKQLLLPPPQRQNIPHFVDCSSEHLCNKISQNTDDEGFYIAENGKNIRPHHYRSDLNSVRKLRRRAIFKNGDCNVVQVHIAERSRRYLQDIFTTLVDAQWRWTFLTFTMSFLLSWFGFALVWWLIAYTHGDLWPENRNNVSWTPCVTNLDGLVSCFMFSMETQHSTGYGSRYPTTECVEAVTLVCAQSIIGVMIQAFMVGIVFAKMARPKQRKQTLLFSRNCVICQRNGQLCLLLRVGDMREKSHLINSAVRLYLIQSRRTQEGELLSPHIQELNVQVDDYNESVLLIWPLTVVHKIDVESPLYEMSAAELLYQRFEVVALLEGTSESTGQTTQVRTSYVPSEVLWGHRFEPIVKYNKGKLAYEVDYDLFHNTYQVDTPLCSAEELQRYLLGHAEEGTTNSDINFVI